jgi:hypothetical protein
MLFLIYLTLVGEAVLEVEAFLAGEAFSPGIVCKKVQTIVEAESQMKYKVFSLTVARVRFPKCLMAASGTKTRSAGKTYVVMPSTSMPYFVVPLGGSVFTLPDCVCE